MAQTPHIVGVVNGPPFDARTWSGCSKHFWTAFERRGVLVDTVGVQQSRFKDLYFKALGFQPDRTRWRFKVGTDPSYRRANTRTALRQLDAIPGNRFDTILQVGAYYDITRYRDKRTVSYHDQNLFALVSGELRYVRVGRQHIQDALAFESGVYNNSRFLFTMSRWAADSFVRDAGVSATKIEVVGAGINADQFPKPGPKRYDRCNILFIGYDFERKGGRTLLEAFTIVRGALPQATLTIVGPKSMERLPAGATWLGPLSKDNPAGLNALGHAYETASVFTLPSLWEPFGIALIEAMAHELPCVGTNVCAIPEIIGEAECGYVVPPSDANALAAKLLDLLSDASACAQMGRNGSRRARSAYTWDVVAGKILDRLACL